MDRRQGAGEKFGDDRRLTTGVWMGYLIAAATLAVTRVALLMWLNDRHAPHTATQTEYLLLDWLYPEVVVSLFWNSLVSSPYGLTSTIWCGVHS